MRRKTGRIRKIALLMLTTGCIVAAASAAYAGAPSSGPASDNRTVEERQMSEEGQAKQESMPPAGEIQESTQAGEGAVLAVTQGETRQTPEVQQNPETRQTPEAQPVPETQAALETQAAQETRAAAGLAEEIQKEAEAAGLVWSGGRYIDPAKPMIALTFDDGPYAPVGNRIMDSLEKYNGRATFFVVGNRVAEYQTEIKRMHDNGHEIANHTYGHKYLNKLGADEIRSQVELCNQAVAAVTGESPRLVRLPGGNKNDTVLGNVNYPMIMWNIDTLDWKTKNADKTVQAVIGKVKDGDIVLMHELYTASGDAAVRIIPTLTEQGFQLVTVSELIRFRGGVKNGGVYYSFRPR